MWSYPRSFIDRTSQRTAHTFFGEGIAAHIGFAEPISAKLRNLLAESARSLGIHHSQRRHLCEHGRPGVLDACGIRLQSRHRFDVIAMTNLPEAKLAREAEIALATMAMITDYDSLENRRGTGLSRRPFSVTSLQTQRPRAEDR